MELNGRSYVRNDRFKLTNKGELFDLSGSACREIPVASDTTDAAAIAARKHLQEILDQHPAAPGAANQKAGKAGKKKARQQP